MPTQGDEPSKLERELWGFCKFHTFWDLGNCLLSPFLVRALLACPSPPFTTPFVLVIFCATRAAWLTESMERVILDLGVVNSNPTLGVEVAEDL